MLGDATIFVAHALEAVLAIAIAIILAKSQMYVSISSSVRPAESQLNDGELLYASMRFGHVARTSPANVLDCWIPGVPVSIQQASQNGANAFALSAQHLVPPLNR